MPRLDAKEVAAVFSAPFAHFLQKRQQRGGDGDDDGGGAGGKGGKGKGEVAEEEENKEDGDEENWYEGSWTTWHKRPWRMHVFHVPVDPRRVTRPRVRDGGLAAIGEDRDADAGAEGRLDADAEDETAKQSFKVWGMTARILVDAAMVAYGRAPGFEHNSHLGDEDVIGDLFRMGRFGEKSGAGGLSTAEDTRKAKEALSKM